MCIQKIEVTTSLGNDSNIQIKKKKGFNKHVFN